MRLHLNENTVGCSPAVLETIRGLGRCDIGSYPDYDTAYEAVSGHFGVPVDHLLLTNGLDEGILAAAAAACRDHSEGTPEGLGVLPAFDEYETCTAAVGGRMVTVPMNDDFDFPLAEFMAAVTPRTRIVFLSNPHNPSGRTLPVNVFRDLALRLPPPALFLLDEAYADFSGDSLIDPSTFVSLPRLIVGRTFSKAYGLAGLRVGVLVGAPATLAPLRKVVPPFSVNNLATLALPVAIADLAYRQWYLEQAAESRGLLTAACARLGLRTWPTEANFLLIRVGDAGAVIGGLAARGIRVRDRSRDHGCAGCIRMTAGIVEDTLRAIDALEEVLCAAR